MKQMTSAVKKSSTPTRSGLTIGGGARDTGEKSGLISTNLILYVCMVEKIAPQAKFFEIFGHNDMISSFICLLFSHQFDEKMTKRVNFNTFAIYFISMNFDRIVEK